MNAYPNNIGQWEERDGIRIEAFHDGSWTAYTTAPPFRCIASADSQRATNIEAAVIAANEARQQLSR